MIVPISQITNIYRTNVVGNTYDFNNFTLAVEMNGGIKYMAVYPRGGAQTLEIFNPVIDAVRVKMAVNGGVSV